MDSFQVCTLTMMSEPVTWVSICLLKMALLGLGLYFGFTPSYLDPNDPTKALLSVDGCQIIVAVRRYECGTSCFTILLIS